MNPKSKKLQKRLLALLLTVCILLGLSACGVKNDGDGTNDPPQSGTNDPSQSGTNDPSQSGTNDPPQSGTNDPSQSGTNDPSQPGTEGSQENAQTSPYQVTQEQWEAILASAFDSYTCDASQINGQIYKMCPADGLYYREFLSGDSEYYYVCKGDKVDYYFVTSYRTGMTADEPWASHERNANGGFEFSSDWLDWLPGIYNLGEFQYSEDDRAYTFYNSSEYFEFYFENGKLIRMVYDDEKGEREYSGFGTTEISLPEVE